MISRSTVTACALLGVLLQGCMTVYTPASNEATTTVRNVGFGSLRMCKGGKMFTLPDVKGVANAVTVPAGQRVSLGATLTSEGYQVHYHCSPFLSFVPESGKTYVANSALHGDGRCMIEVVREDASGTAGLALEPTVGPAECRSR